MRNKFVLLIALSLAGLPTLVAAQQLVAPLTANQKASLKYSDKWFSKALQLEKGNKLPEAIAATEKSLGLRLEVRDELHPDLVRTWELLGRLHGKREDFPAAQKALGEVLHIQE